MNTAANNLTALPQPEDEEEEVPSAAVIESIKAQFVNRSLNRVEMTASDGTSFVFVMTGPTRADWKKYQDELTRAGVDGEKKLKAVETAALAQIRWPDRAEVVQILDNNPALALNFAEQLNDLARLNVEVVAKKL